MKLRLLCVALLAVGCSHAPVGQRSEHDEVCGVARRVEVRLRSPVVLSRELIDCPEALALVARNAPDLGEGWTVIYTGGFTGLALDSQMQARHPAGMTYADRRLIVLRPGDESVLAHELGHAWDWDHEQPNRRDAR